MKKKDNFQPKYIVKQIGEDGIGFYIIHKAIGPVYVVERYDDVPFQLYTMGRVNLFDEESNIEATNIYEIPIKDIINDELYYSQEGAIGAAFRLATKFKMEDNQ